MDHAETPDSTSLSLLGRLKAQDREGWQRFVDLYGPLIYHWCRQAGLGSNDAQDVAQEVFAAVFQRVVDFRRHRPGDSFRGWLWTVVRSKIGDHFRARQSQPGGRGGTAAHHELEQLPELPATLPRLSESDALVSQRVYELVRPQFEDRTWQAFWRLAVDQRSGPEVAEELHLSLQAVYQAKSRVLRRIREEFGELLH